MCEVTLRNISNHNHFLVGFGVLNRDHSINRVVIPRDWLGDVVGLWIRFTLE